LAKEVATGVELPQIVIESLKEIGISSRKIGISLDDLCISLPEIGIFLGELPNLLEELANSRREIHNFFFDSGSATVLEACGRSNALCRDAASRM